MDLFGAAASHDRPQPAHQQFVNLRTGTQAEFKALTYAFAATRFGESCIASTPRGICSLGFPDHRDAGLQALRARFPAARLREGELDGLQQQALAIVEGAPPDEEWPLDVHVLGTDFQAATWRLLLRIPGGQTTTYQQLADRMGQPRAAQAVGNAVGANPIAWLVPCHRVVRTDGKLGGFAWGLECKRQMLLAERL